LASSSSPYDDDLFGNRLQALQLAQTQKRIAKDGRRVSEAAAAYGATSQGSPSAARSGGQDYGPLARQAGSAIGQLGGSFLGGALVKGVGSLFGGGTTPNFWPAASNVGNSAATTGFSMKGSLLG